MSNGNIRNIAVFIDGDNISSSHYQKIIDELKQTGRILTQRLYADFSDSTSSAWRGYIMNYGIDAIQTFRIAKKESTDNCLIVDCMRTLYHHQMIEMFVIVSSDSDFSSLASEIRMKGKFCIGVGYNHTPMKLRNNCDRFIVIETLLETKNKNKNDKSKDKDKESKDNKDNKDKDNKDKNKEKSSTDIDRYFNDHSKFLALKSFKEFFPHYTDEQNIIVKDDTVYWLRLDYFKDNIRDIIFKVIEDSDRNEIHMSWLKDKLLTIDSSFDQRAWGFTKMTDFASMIIYNTSYVIEKDKNGEFVIKMS
jgi:uncharacterized LabA/DUF88 family protein